jgi:hypothetical protein
VEVAWPLPAGSSGTPRSSHPVHIILTREALEDYMQGKPATKRIAERRFDEWLRRRLEDFQPKSGQPVDGPRP